MTTLAISVQKKRKDNFWPVYIRVIHNGAVAYIKTDKMVHDSHLGKTKEIRDPYITQELNRKIIEYMDRLNRKDASRWTALQIAQFLKNEDEDVCFSEYARKHIANMFNNGQERTSQNYRHAVESLELYAGTTKVMFSALTSVFLNQWIKSLEHTKRAKEMYPVCVRQIFKAAYKELNDEENNLIRIKFNPWLKVEIPKSDPTEKLAITPEECREFFSAPLPESKFVSPLPELAKDVVKMVLCLGGINTADLYNLKKTDYHHGIIHYFRAKTKKFRADKAYMEMRVPPIIEPLFRKYQAQADDEYLFNFHARYTTSDSFSANINSGLKKICDSMGIPKDSQYCVYTFRHTWGTVAQNDCGASISDVAFGMNHAAGHTITRGYLKLNFEPAWKLNEKVIDLIFFSDTKSHRANMTKPENKTKEPTELQRFSAKYMMRGTAYFKGQKLGEIQDIGFDNVEQIIKALVQFIPDDVPVRSAVQFKIENLDKNQVSVHERTKGKGF